MKKKKQKQKQLHSTPDARDSGVKRKIPVQPQQWSVNITLLENAIVSSLKNESESSS